MCGCMAAQVKVHEGRLGLLWLKLKYGPVCDDSSDSVAEGGGWANATPYKWTSPLVFNHYYTGQEQRRGINIKIHGTKLYD